MWGSVRAAAGEEEEICPLQIFQFWIYSLLFVHKSTILTGSAIDGILETVSKPHSSVKEVLPVPEIVIIGLLLKSF